jgi:MoxR-like ATPase
MFVRVGYPTAQEETEILRRTTGTLDTALNIVLSGEDLVDLQHLVRSIDVSNALLEYVTQLVRHTRPQDTDSKGVKEYVRWGAGPRAGQALVLCSKANALLQGRFAVTLNDIHQVAHSVLRHRILVNFQAEAQNITTDAVIDELLNDLEQPQSPLTR